MAMEGILSRFGINISSSLVVYYVFVDLTVAVQHLVPAFFSNPAYRLVFFDRLPLPTKL